MYSPDMALEITYQTLPHWRLEGASYFVTWRLMPGQPAMSTEERSIVADALNFFDGIRCKILAWVVMDDHVHVVVRPLPGWTLDSLLHSWKSFTANRMKKRGRLGRVWLTEAFDRIIRDDAELAQKVGYVLDNPRRRWPRLRSYDWVGGVALD